MLQEDCPALLFQDAVTVLCKDPVALTLTDALTAANLLDACVTLPRCLPKTARARLLDALRGFLFRNLGTTEARMLAERSWAASDLLESIIEETEALFEMADPRCRSGF